MPEEDFKDDVEQTPPHTDILDESDKAQINRMAGCARFGKWMVIAGIVIMVAFYLYRWINGGPMPFINP